MLRSIAAACAAGSLAMVLAKEPARAQTVSLDSLLRSQRYPLSSTARGLSGPGADLLMRAAEGTQFVALGEPHNAKQVPQLAAMLFDLLRERHGYAYLVLESGPVITRRAVAAARHGQRDSVYALARRYPNGFAFNTDQEMAMLADVAVASAARATPVWGVDQAFGGLHILERLREIAPTQAARRVATGVIEHAREFEQTRAAGERRYISRMARPEDLVALRGAFGGTPGSEADLLVSTLEISHRIYQNNIQSSAANPTGYLSNHEREEYMKTNFMDNYRAAQAAGDSLPRVLLKLGHWHTIRGANWGDVHTLGNFAAEFARANGRSTLHIAMYLNNGSGDYGVLAQYPDYKPFADAGDPAGLVLLDLRPLRRFAAANRIEGLTEEQKRVIFGFDLVLLVGGVERATFEHTLPR